MSDKPVNLDIERRKKQFSKPLAPVDYREVANSSMREVLRLSRALGSAKFLSEAAEKSGDYSRLVAYLREAKT